ncbi:MAG: hypothetical protein ACR2N2_02220 [Acidimicrobiia bacterium]
MHYDHVQRGYGPYFYVPISVFMLAVMSADGETPTWVVVLTGTFLLVILIVLVAFNRLHITVEDGALTARFGWGKPHRTFDLSDMIAVRRLRNRWWMGWGVRKIPSGWMYNVWGLDAVEVDLSDGTSFRMGTNDAENLLAAISLRMHG